eukprot:2254807-Pleurochrysis_carterae.AAC.6
MAHGYAAIDTSWICGSAGKSGSLLVYSAISRYRHSKYPQSVIDLRYEMGTSAMGMSEMAMSAMGTSAT